MNCYDSKTLIKPFDLLVSEESGFDLTRERVYVAKSAGFGNLVRVVNDKGVEEVYTTEHFRFYEGETIGF